MTIQSDILEFWFEQTPKESWFKKDDAFDDALRERFSDVLARASQGAFEEWRDTPAGRLALILVLDQFSRNLRRGEGAAFANDSRARDIARQAITAGDHVGAEVDVPTFLFLPFEHSEALADQLWSLSLFAGLGDENKDDYAHRHYVIIERFGRFPHRNEALGRESTAEEIEFLKQPNSSF